MKYGNRKNTAHGATSAWLKLMATSQPEPATLGLGLELELELELMLVIVVGSRAPACPHRTARFPSQVELFGSRATLDNYTRVLTDDFYLLIIRRTLLAGAMIVGIALVIGYPVAFAIARLRCAVAPPSTDFRADMTRARSRSRI